MLLRWLEVTDFRMHKSVALQPSEGLTVIRGPNGSGKTSLLEAIGYLATLSSFRGAGSVDLIRAGTAGAILRGEFAVTDRRLLVETEVRPAGERNRTQVNRQPLRRAADLQEQVPVLTFQPDDLLVVKGSPGSRRDAIDGAVVSLNPRVAEDRRRLSVCLRQRNALLRQIGPGGGQRMDADSRRSLDIWDDRLAAAAEAWGGPRRPTVEGGQPRKGARFPRRAGAVAAVPSRSFSREWSDSSGGSAATPRSRWTWRTNRAGWPPGWRWR